MTEFFRPSNPSLSFSAKHGKHGKHKTDKSLADITKRVRGYDCMKQWQQDIDQLGQEFKIYSLAGYPDDEGVRLGGGRPGADKGPDAIRQALMQLTPDDRSTTRPMLLDLGNLMLKSELSQRHEIVKKQAAEALSRGSAWIGLGGGHDYGYADAYALVKWSLEQQQRPLVISFDSQLNMHNTDAGISHNTVLSRLINDFSDKFDLAVIGAQSHCNSPQQWQWSRQQGVRVLGFDDILYSGHSLVEKSIEVLDDWMIRSRPTCISLDMSCFSSAYAMGCSQSWATGLAPDDFLRLLQILCQRLRIQVFGLYELSPLLDVNNCTAKLAAQILHRYIYPL